MTLLGFQASSLRPYLTTEDEVQHTFHKLHNMGYRFVQLQWIDPAVPLASTAEALRETGLKCIATQEDFTVVRNNLDYYVTMNRLWESDSLCVSTIPHELMTPEGIEEFCDAMGQMARTLGEHGIALTFHPLWFNYEYVNGIRAIDIVMEQLPEVGLTLCVYHAVRAGEDPVALLERYQGRVNICHFKDSALSTEGKEYLVPLGQGRIDWLPIFEACHRTGVIWGLVEQENWQKDAFDCAKDSLDYLTNSGITSSNV